ncbi:MAG: hypothetical protein DRQ41_15255 [Gammaproteobacteria bacterium]|nr:MAG: hypothetical protein DRQ41_15255 [Gammaproteobacteria bacterium]
MKIKIRIGNMRISGPDKQYHQNQLQIFADTIASKVDQTITRVDFAKQDMRGSLSITLFDDNHCVPMQKHFSSKDALIGYVCGYNHANRDVKYI